MNQPTGKYDGWWILSSLTSELMYAGYDKFNDTLGGNPATGGECWACYSHSSYFAEIPSEFLMNSQGQYINNAGRVVTERQKVSNPLYTDFTDKWGIPIENINPSIPVLVKPKQTQSEGVYDESDF